MGTSHWFLATDGEHEKVLAWFRGLAKPPEELPAEGVGVLLCFHAFGDLVYDSGTGQLDARKSPLVSVFLPIKKRGVLWTAGEVHFLPTPMSKVCPPLASINRSFRKWLTHFERVFALDPTWQGKWDYYLEGSIRNHAPEVFALPNAMNALRQGHYFVAERDNDSLLDKICQSLRLRGVNCVPDA
jgi:hypothetical protein